MPFAKTVPTKVFDEASGLWINGPDVLLTKNSFSHAIENNSNTQVWMSDGTFIMVGQDLATIEAFLNS